MEKIYERHNSDIHELQVQHAFKLCNLACINRSEKCRLLYLGSLKGTVDLGA
jgi:hypothetical protein